MSNAPPQKAIIMGCGVAGPALGIFLRRIGWEVTIIESRKKHEGSILGGGLQIAPNGMRVLGSAGVADTIMKQGARLNHMEFFNQYGKSLGRIRNGTPGLCDYPAVTLSRNFVQDTLVDKAIEVGVTVLYDKKVIEITQTESSVTVTFADKTTATADILVGADGIGSLVREKVFPGSPVPEFSRMLGIGGFVRLENFEHNDEMRMVFGRFGQFGLCGANQDPHEFLWWSRLAAPERPTKSDLMAITTEDLRKQLKERYVGWPEPFPTILNEAKEILAIPISFLPSLPTWHKGRVVLIGDAAHAMTPNAGQGASVALEDTIVLAKCLKDYPLSEAFKQYESERKTRAETIATKARKNTEMLHELSPWKAWFRDQIFSWIFYYFGEKMMNKFFTYSVDL